MPDDYCDLRNISAGKGVEHPLDERLACCLVEHLCKAGVHAGALAGSEDNRGGCHSVVRLGEPTVFRWGDRDRTRNGWTKTSCVANYTTPQSGR